MSTNPTHQLDSGRGAPAVLITPNGRRWTLRTTTPAPDGGRTGRYAVEGAICPVLAMSTTEELRAAGALSEGTVKSRQRSADRWRAFFAGTRARRGSGDAA